MVTESIIKQLVDRIKFFDPEKIILFGSYAYGSPSKDSDVDLFVIKRVNLADVREMRVNIRSHLRDIIYNQNIPVDILLDNQDHINERIELGDSVYKEIMSMGRIVYEK